LNWLKNTNRVLFDLLLLGGGELKAEFGMIGAERFMYMHRAIRRYDFIRKMFLQYAINWRSKPYSILYCNTIVSAVHLHDTETSLPIVTHVHELENIIDTISEEKLNKLIGRTRLFIAASQPVKDTLVRRYGIEAKRVEVVHSFISTSRFSGNSVSLRREEILGRYGIPKDSFVIGACGTVDHRKAPDLFVALAQEFRKINPGKQVFFFWLGGIPDETLLARARETGNVIFAPRAEDSASYLNAFDLFALVSRHDPFPLVCLEAASLGKPIVCFAESGGMKDFVEDDCGCVVSGMSVPQMASKISELVNDPILSRRLGENAARKVRARHDVSVAAPLLLERILSVVSCTEREQGQS